MVHTFIRVDILSNTVNDVAAIATNVKIYVASISLGKCYNKNR